MRIERGLPDAMRDQAAALYWEAFGPKLDRVMGPSPRARAFVARAIRTDHVIAATDGGQLLGLAGFKTAQGAFVGGSARELRRAYGFFGAAWRGIALSMLHTDVDNERFLIDGLCVAAPWRGRGIGTALIAAICHEGARRGYEAVRLDVVDTNLRARALYERLGFVAVGSDRLGAAAPLFGFGATVTMVRGL